MSDKKAINIRYYSENKELSLFNVRFKQKEMYSKKNLVWACFSDKGIPEPLIWESRAEALNKDIYFYECLIKRVLKFIQKLNKDKNYLF